MGFILLIMIAGMGIGAPLPFNSREKFMNKRIQIEQVEEQEEVGFVDVDKE